MRARVRVQARMRAGQAARRPGMRTRALVSANARVRACVRPRMRGLQSSMRSVGVVAYIVMAYTVMAYTGMAYIVMAYTVMAADIVMAYIVMAIRGRRSEATC